ncbi:aldehyde dehydrogenase family protein [Micromonospora echinofusca]|uniref:Sulfoacetaldehyde dehydrogenase n=1 Tax=Micromonospora echinofusca TaxID=47858 RepID=A0A1C5G7D3_MICEH|nr:aldehyde dehydrogenase family protein [Micromonospora echinofusca]SCG15784.1 sulfoacetaldehyde dehydrogenase [Micromonospora echinofusca]
MVTHSVAAALARARAAQAQAEHWSQDRVDAVVAAVGWRCYAPEQARALSTLAYDETRLGDREHLYTLHRRRVLGTLQDLHGVTTVGVVEDRPDLGVQKLAKPIGVIAVASPSTAPCSGVIGNALPMLKTRNAVVFSPNPSARISVLRTVEVMRAALAQVGAPVDLVQCLEHSNREAAEALMRAADLVVAVGGGGTVARAYMSGTPAISAGVGNATVVVDDSADLKEAATKIVHGGGFNNGTSCSSESNVLVDATVEVPFAAELARAGAHLCDDQETARLRTLLWNGDGRLNRDVIGRSAATLAAEAKIQLSSDSTSVLIARVPDVDLADVLFTEKLAPVVTLTPYRHFDDAVAAVAAITDACGRGHSCGIHSHRPDRVARLAERVRLCRVMVNQSTAVGNSGSFENGLPFTSTVASGSWGGCAQSENVTWRNFVNYTSVSRPVQRQLRTEEELFGGHWSAHGRSVGPVCDALYDDTLV